MAKINRHFFTIGVIFLIAIALACFVSAQDANESTDNSTANVTQDNTNVPIANDTTPIVIEEPVTDFNIIGFTPTQTKIGDVQLNIQLKNTGNTELNNLYPLVSGDGFSTVNVQPIDSMQPGEKSYLFVMGTFAKAGNINLTIRLMNKVFYRIIAVVDPNAADNKEKLAQQQKEEEARKAMLASLSAELTDMQSKYHTLETDFNTKKADNYDLSAVSITDLKNYLRDAQANIVIGDTAKANASLQLALAEFGDQKNNLDAAKKIETSIFDTLSKKAVIISTTVGGILASFTLYEVLKKRKGAVVTIIDKTKKHILKEKKAENKESPKEEIKKE